MENSMQQKAARLRDLHRGPGILVLPNAWDVASARVIEEAGFVAIATTSAGVANALGYPDGERIPRDVMLAVVARIAAAVQAPVTADMEAGYGASIEAVVETARAVIAAGAVGMNLEDTTSTGAGPLEGISRQAEKIRAIRAMCDDAAVPFVLNARTDVYLAEVGAPEGRFDEAVRRLNAYRQAGADCLFVPGVRDAATIERLVQAIDGPVNILAVAGTPPLAELARLGVARVSLGSGPMRATMALLRRIATELRERGTYSGFTENSMAYAEANRLFE